MPRTREDWADECKTSGRGREGKWQRGLARCQRDSAGPTDVLLITSGEGRLSLEKNHLCMGLKK